MQILQADTYRLAELPAKDIRLLVSSPLFSEHNRPYRKALELAATAGVPAVVLHATEARVRGIASTAKEFGIWMPPIPTFIAGLWRTRFRHGDGRYALTFLAPDFVRTHPLPVEIPRAPVFTKMRINPGCTMSVEENLPFIAALTQPGDLVCDLFCGTGPVGVAACLLGRDFIGCDIDQAAVNIANQRLGVGWPDEYLRYRKHLDTEGKLIDDLLGAVV